MEDENFSGNTKALRKDIKRAKLFAIQHLTRRIKMLKNKRGTEQQVEKNTRKAARFEEELECIKELDIDAVIIKIQNKDLNDCVMVVAEDVEERAIARLISSKPIQDHIKQQNQTNNSRQNQKFDNSEDHLSEPEAEPKISQTLTRKKTNSKLRAKEENLNPSNASPLPPYSSSDNDSIQSDIEVKLQRTTTSFFVESLSSVKNHDHGTTRQNNKPGKQRENNSSNKSRNAKKAQKAHAKQPSICSQKERKESSNRMGQRARQRLWKEQYGKKANHVKSNDKITKPKHDHKKQRQETKMKGTKREQNSETASHPSWEASKRRKLQQNISQTTFQGQKITFDDSD